MGTTKIEWTDKVWNPITGCSPISEGCQNCYAKPMAYRLRGIFGYPKDDPFRVTFHPDRLNEPHRWKKPCRIFVCSMGDLFHQSIPNLTIDLIWRVMKQCFHHTFLILTKRPKRLLIDYETKNGVLDNVWLGVSVENQRTADERIAILLQIPAAKRFVSVEPMLGPIDLNVYTPLYSWLGGAYSAPRETIINPGPRLNWVICGGETGPGARPMNPDWARRLRDDCKKAGVPFFFKQMSGKKPIPKDLMVREFPK